MLWLKAAIMFTANSGSASHVAMVLAQTGECSIVAVFVDKGPLWTNLVAWCCWVGGAAAKVERSLARDPGCHGRRAWTQRSVQFWWLAACVGAPSGRNAIERSLLRARFLSARVGAKLAPTGPALDTLPYPLVLLVEMLVDGDRWHFIVFFCVKCKIFNITE